MNIPNNNSGIKSWSKDDRPREKMLLKGVSSLSDAELLAILINNGYKNKTALDLSKEILDNVHRNWNELGKLSWKELMRIKGIGEAKAITIVAALEIGRRRQAGNLLNRPVIKTSKDAADFLQPMLADQRREIFCVLFLNRSNKIIHFEILSEGGISGTVVDPRIIMKKALEYEASALLLCHNHPSGNLTPSKADVELTKKIKGAASLLDITIIDHLIISEEGYNSLADEGLM